MYKMVLKAKEIREYSKEERFEKLEELKRELMHERGVAAMGGSPPSPGKIRQLRTSIARMLTIMHEEGEQ
jgi:large subunit ribosomal protein L29